MSKVLKIKQEFENRIEFRKTGFEIATHRQLRSGVRYEGDNLRRLLTIKIAATETQSDFYELAGLLFCSARMKDVVSKLEGNSQFLQVGVDLLVGIFDTSGWDTDYYLWNILKSVKTLDIIDKKRGKFRIDYRKKFVSEIKRLGIRDEQIEENDLFRLFPDFEFVVAGDKLASQILDAELKGFDFVPPESVGTDFDFLDD